MGTLKRVQSLSRFLTHNPQNGFDLAFSTMFTAMRLPPNIPIDSNDFFHLCLSPRLWRLQQQCVSTPL